MSWRTDMAANYASQLYVVLVGIAVTPLYLAQLGPEAYGLIGFFTVLLAWFQLLDLGLSPALVRETARQRAGALGAVELRAIVRAMAVVFVSIAVVVALSVAAASQRIATDWLRAESLPSDVLTEALLLMAANVGLRFVSIVPRAVLTGAEAWRWLAGFNAVIATLRAFAVLPAMAVFGATPRTFFTVQLIVAAIEWGGLSGRARRALPSIDVTLRLVNLRPLRGVARFSAAVAFTGGLTVVLSQADRLILSGLLELRDYAHFNLATLVASAVLLGGSPIGSAMLPRFSALHAKPGADGLPRLYLLATHAMSLTTLPVAIVMAMHPAELLWAWTGDAQAARAGAPVLALYALGNSVAAHLMLPYGLQFATARLRRHVVGNALLIALLIPAQIILTMRFGAIGAGMAWLTTNLLYALVWVPHALRPIDREAFASWLWSTLRSAAAATAAVTLLWPLRALAVEHGRVATVAFLASSALLGCTAVLMAGGPLRAGVLAQLARLRPSVRSAAEPTR